MYKHILVPTDGSDLSDAAITQTLDLAKEVNAKVTILTVIEPFHVFSTHTDQLVDSRAEYLEHAHQRAEKLLAGAIEKAKERGVAYASEVIEGDHPYEAIIAGALKHGCDLIAMASHGRRGVSALILGSETTKVLTHSTIPVLVYRYNQ